LFNYSWRAVYPMQHDRKEQDQAKEAERDYEEEIHGKGVFIADWIPRSSRGMTMSGGFVGVAVFMPVDVVFHVSFLFVIV
jgi:hypothetical protein